MTNARKTQGGCKVVWGHKGDRQGRLSYDDEVAPLQRS